MVDFVEGFVVPVLCFTVWSHKVKVLIAVKMLMVVFCVVTLCGLVSGYHCFGGTYCLHLHDWSNEGSLCGRPPSKVYLSCMNCWRSKEPSILEVFSSYFLCCNENVYIPCTECLIHNYEMLHYPYILKTFISFIKVSLHSWQENSLNHLSSVTDQELLVFYKLKLECFQCHNFFLNAKFSSLLTRVQWKCAW
jgi:hypothetical protein